MKNKYLLYLLVLWFMRGQVALAQCPTGNVTLTTQAQVNAFPAGCSALPGSLRISGADITNLSGLESLTSIGGQLNILANSSLTSVSSLSALRQVGGILQIALNPALPTLSGLESLTSVGENLTIANNLSLSSVSGLSVLRQVGGSLQIGNNAALPNLSGLESLTSIGSSLSIADSPSLTSVSSLSALRQVGVGFIIENNAALPTLSGLQSLTSIGWLLRIQNNTQLSTCATESICRLLPTLTGNITISGNAPGCATLAEVEANCPGPGITGLAPSPTLVCVGSPVTFTATISNVVTPYSFTLTNGAGTLIATTSTSAFSQSLTASGSGVQAYTLTVSNGGTPATAVTSLTVLASDVTRLYVKANATGANTGLSWQDAFTDLQSALRYPCTGSLREIWIARGVYNRGAQPFAMLPDVAIYGGFEGTETDLSQRPSINLSNPPSTTLTGQAPFTGFYYIIENLGNLTNTAILDGVEITIPTSGSLSSGITNRAGNGQVCSPQFRNLLFRGHRNTGNPQTSNGLFVQNDAPSGGEVSPSFVNCVFRDNQAINLIGRFYNVSNNNSVVRPQFISCVIANHTGDSFLLNFPRGGQIQPRFINCSFLNVPNGISYETAVDNGSTLDFQFTNCVLWNTGGNNTFRKSDTGVSYTINAQYSLLDQAITGYTSGPGNLTATGSPFVSANDVNLPNSSPAVNAGNPNSVTVASAPYSATNLPQTDVAANPRLVGSRVDMGALEVQNPTPPCGTVVYVTQNGAGLQNGSSWTNAFAGTALQTAINTAANCGAQVWVAQGVYKPTTGTDRSISFVMKPGVAIYGGFRGTETQLSDRPTTITITDQSGNTTLSGDLKGDDGPNFANSSDNSYHVIRNDDNALNNKAVLDGFVISGGNANGNGTPDTRGGALYNFNSSPSLINCILQNNSAALNGGAIYNVGSNLSLINCTFQNNTASNGGAIYNNVSNPSLVNCSLQANAVTMNGGAIYNNISSPGLINCSLQNNSATLNGGAIYNIGNSSPNLINLVLFNNGGANTIVNSGGSVTASYSLFDASVTGYTDGGNNLITTVTPFASTTGTQLRDCSVAINSGSNQAYSAVNGPATDLAGNARQYNSGVIDRGAYEYQGTPTTLAVTNPVISTATVGQAFNQAFTASGGSGLYSFSVVSSNLPSSLSLSASGVLSGTPTTAGSYSVLVQVSDANSCAGIASTAYNLTINPAAPLAPTITGFAASPQAVCVGSPITFTATIGNISGNYSWSLQNGGPPIGSPSPTTATAFSVVQTASGSGVQTFTLTVNSGGQSVTATTSLTVNALPIASLTNNGPLTCAQTSVTLMASGGTSYTFTNGSGQLVPGSGNTRTVSSPGAYSVTVGDVNGCVITASTTVDLDVNAPSVSISPSSATLTCTSSSVSLTAVGNGSVRWEDKSTNPIRTVSMAGIYSVTLTSGSGCTATASVAIDQQPDQTVAIVQQPTPVSSVTVGATVTTRVLVSGQPTGYQWYKDNLSNPVTGQTSATLNLTNVQLSDAGSYSVVVTGTCNSLTSSAFSLLVTAPVDTAPFAITAVTTVSCTPILPNRFSISFSPRYSGLTGRPISFSVANELLPTTEQGPYTLQLYTDNPIITLKATQAGSPNETSYAYNWLAACQTSEATNTPPRLVAPIASQTATVGTYFTFVIPDGTFTDTETPLSLRLSAVGYRLDSALREPP